MKNIRLLSLLLCMAMMLSLAACGGGGASDTTNAVPAEEAAEPAGEPAEEEVAGEAEPEAAATTSKTNLVVGAGVEPSGWDPLAEGTPGVILAGMCIYDKLFQVDENGEIVGDLVESWEYSGEDNLTLTLHLKEGVTFHNGNPFTADDALFTIARIANHMVYASRTASLDLDNCAVIDDYTLELKLKYYDVLFLACLTGECGFVYDKETCEEVGVDAYSASPMGTGPYSFVNWNRGTSIELARFDGYWGDPASFDSIEIKFYAEDNTRELELEAGELDLVLLENGTNIDRVVNGEVDGVSGYLWTTDKLGYLCMSTTIEDTTFQDENKRLALASAIDTPAIVNAVMGSAGDPATSCLSENHWAYVNSAFTYDIDAAKDYLAAAGVPDGFSFNILVASDQNLDVKLAEAIEAYLSQVGIKMEIRSADQFSVMGEQMGGTQLCGILTSTIRGDVMELFDPFTDGSHNFLAQVPDAEFNEYLTAARMNSEMDVRTEALNNLQAYVHDHATFIPLYQLNAAWGYQDYVSGVEDAAMGSEAILDLTQVSFN